MGDARSSISELPQLGTARPDVMAIVKSFSSNSLSAKDQMISTLKRMVRILLVKELVPCTLRPNASHFDLDRGLRSCAFVVQGNLYAAVRLKRFRESSQWIRGQRC